LKQQILVETPHVLVNILLLVKVQVLVEEKMVRKLHTQMLGEDLKNLSQMKEFHVPLLKDIQL
jgi:hypothetical protein